MKPGVYNFTIDLGATLTFQIVWKDDAGQTITLTGYTARMRIFRDGVQLTELLSTGTSPAIVVNTTNCVVTLSAALSETFPANVLHCQFDLLKNDDVVRLFKGKITPYTEDIL